MKASVIGAGFYGSTTAQRLIEYNIFNEVVLSDIKDGWAEGLALDLNESSSIENFSTKVVGKTTGIDGSGYDVISNSDVIVVTAGFPRKPGMSRMDLLGSNAKIVGSVAEQIKKYAPNSVVIVVSNPLDEMTTLMQRITGFDKNKVIGQAGMLDTARFTYFVSLETGVPVNKVKTLTLGSHGETMVPIPSQCSVDSKPLTDILSSEKIDEIIQRVIDGGAEVSNLLKTGSAYYAPSAAAARMAEAVVTDSSKVMPVCAYVNDSYGIKDVYLGVEAELGKQGVVKIVERKLTETELNNLQTAAANVKEKSKGLDQL
jgi:malate dehydrogenase